MRPAVGPGSRLIGRARTCATPETAYVVALKANPLAEHRWRFLDSIHPHLSPGRQSCRDRTPNTTLSRSRPYAQQRSRPRPEEHTSELQSLLRNSYAVLCWKKKKK